jgi:Fe2+ or Zn2+ uptake regulation protein
MFEADRGEVFDLVERKGPISFEKLMQNHISSYSRDGVYSALLYLEEQGNIERIDGTLDEHGTTRELWDVTD